MLHLADTTVKKIYLPATPVQSKLSKVSTKSIPAMVQTNSRGEEGAEQWCVLMHNTQKLGACPPSIIFKIEVTTEAIFGPK